MVWRISLCVLAMFVLGAAMAVAGGGREEAAEELEFEVRAPEEYSGTIVDWRHSDQAEIFRANFMDVYPNVEVDMTIVSSNSAEYTQQVLTAVSTGANAPDMFTAWSQTIGRIVNTGYWANLSAPPFNAEELVGDLVPYTVDLARDAEGNIRALSWQATIGGVYYRRSMAREYLGTDDPDEVGEMMSTVEGMLDVADTIRRESDGDKYFMSHFSEFTPVFESNRDVGWVDEAGNLVIDPKMHEMIDLAEIVWENDYTANVAPFSPGWYGMLQDGQVFGYFLPTWGLQHVIMPNADPESAGDWAITNGPMPYISGGTWAGIYSGSENKELAWEYLKYQIFNEEHLWDYAYNHGDYVSYIPIQEEFAKVRQGHAYEFMGGQNVYEYFNKYREDVNHELITQYDSEFRTFWNNAIESYLTGRRSRDAAIEYFKSEVRTAYPHINIR